MATRNEGFALRNDHVRTDEAAARHRPPDPRDATGPEDEGSSPRLSPSLICVVDDDNGARRGLELILRAAGHTVEAFPGAGAYLAAGRGADTACLILDVHMPGMTGPELQLRLIEDGYRVPIVFVTGDDNDALKQRVMAKGALCLLYKPVDSTALLDAVATALADR